MTTWCLNMVAGSAILGIATSTVLTNTIKEHNSSKALRLIEETTPSIGEITDEKMIALLKTQGITMDVEELSKYREQYNTLSEKEQIQLMRRYADTPLWPWLPGWVVWLLAFCVMGARWGFIN